jgi:hypothetical protein
MPILRSSANEEVAIIIDSAVAVAADFIVVFITLLLVIIVFPLNPLKQIGARPRQRAFPYFRLRAAKPASFA